MIEGLNAIGITGAASANSIEVSGTINASAVGGKAVNKAHITGIIEAAVIAGSTSSGAGITGSITSDRSSGGGVTPSQLAAETAAREAADNCLNEELQKKAYLESPSFTGAPSVPTAAEGAVSDQIANTAFVHTEVKNALNVFDTVEEMKAAASRFANGDVVETRGYYSQNDRGGGQYIIWEGTASDIFSIQLNDTLAASIIRDGNNINVCQYGVKGDGVTDVTDMVNEIFQRAPHDSTIYFPAGEYIFTAPIIPNRLAAIKGDMTSIFRGSTWISADTSGTIFNFDVSSMPNFDDYSEDEYGTTITCNGREYKLDHDGFSFINYGLTYTGSGSVNIENIFFVCNAYDAVFTHANYLTNPDEVYVETVIRPKINCIKMGYNFTIRDCTFEGWSGFALTGWERYNSDGYSSASAWNNIDRCYFIHCRYAILSCIDSQFMNLRINECYTGIIDNGSANLFLNIRMDSMGMYGIKMEGSSCTSSTIIGLDVDVGYGPGLVVHGSHHYIQGHIGRCGGKSSGKTQDEITYEDFPYSCGLLLDDDGIYKCADSKIDVILSYGPIYEYADESELAETNCPAVLIGMTNGSYSNLGLNITTSQTTDNSDILFKNILMARSAALNAPSGVSGSYFRGFLTVNGEPYCVEETIPYPFDNDCVTLNNFFMGFARSPDSRPPTRIGTMMEHYWLDRYCLSVYDTVTGDYRWIDIKNPAIDTGLQSDNAVANAKTVGKEIEFLRHRISNLESALGASSIESVEYGDAWKNVGEKSEMLTITRKLDLSSADIEIVMDLSSVTTTPAELFCFYDANRHSEYCWNATGYHLSISGTNILEPSTFDTETGFQAWGPTISVDFSKPVTIRISKHGISVNDVPVTITQSKDAATYQDKITTLISTLLSSGKYSMFFLNNTEYVIKNISIMHCSQIASYTAALDDSYITSPNGTKFRITVANDGSLSASPV